MLANSSHFPVIVLDLAVRLVRISCVRRVATVRVHTLPEAALRRGKFAHLVVFQRGFGSAFWT